MLGLNFYIIILIDIYLALFLLFNIINIKLII